MTSLHILPGTRALITAGDARTAARIETLLVADAKVRVVTPHVCATIQDWADRDLISWDQRQPTMDDVLDADLVVNARHDPDESLTGEAGAEKSVKDEPRGNNGSVILVGGGPSDPGLLTVAGLAALQGADVVVTDRLAPLAALDALPEHVEIIDVAKIPYGRSATQEDINQILVERARAGLRVVRLKGGDSFVFGRGGEEIEACAAAGIPVKVIPGVTSAVSAPALAGIPVTHRGLVQGFTVVSGHLAPDHPESTINWSALARSGTTIVILMGVRNLPAITKALVANGLDASTPAAVIADAARTSQRMVRGTVATVAELAARDGIAAPSVTVIGHVASFDAGPTVGLGS